MKKAYVTPTATKVEFNYSQHVVASGCYWQNNGYWTHGTQGCQNSYHEGTGSSVPA